MEFKFFPALFDKPRKIKFENQEVDEQIELFLRRHPIVNVPWIVAAVIAFFLPFVLVLLDSRLNLNIITQVPSDVILGALIIYYMLIFAFVLERFLFWYYNIYIVTNLHLVDINFLSLLSRDISEIELDDIQNITSDIKGIFASLFNFGSVIIKTAADREMIDFTNVPRPDFVADRIQDLREVYISKKSI
ncbi:PH domain-containing protein [Candidatus Daviesbacteria bacterium]|nr:PH domain-containing protein [Candidatus Daviesbacteria bacterium]